MNNQVFELVFQHLNPRQIMDAAAVCRDWYAKCTSTVWAKIAFVSESARDCDIVRAAERFRFIYYDLSYRRGLTDVAFCALRGARGLHLDHTMVTDRALVEFGNVEILSVANCPQISDFGISALKNTKWLCIDNDGQITGCTLSMCAELVHLSANYCAIEFTDAFKYIPELELMRTVIDTSATAEYQFRPQKITVAHTAGDYSAATVHIYVACVWNGANSRIRPNVLLRVMKIKNRVIGICAFA